MLRYARMAALSRAAKNRQKSKAVLPNVCDAKFFDDNGDSCACDKNNRFRRLLPRNSHLQCKTKFRLLFVANARQMSGSELRYRPVSMLTGQTPHGLMLLKIRKYTLNFFTTRMGISTGLALAASLAAADPMTFREVSNGGACAGCIWIAAEGDITSETPAVFREWFGVPSDGNGGPTIVINSQGGDLTAALELGRLFRAHSVRIRIGDTEPDPQGGGHVSKINSGQCLSACAYAYLGAEVRVLTDDETLGFHQFYDEDILANADRAAFSGVERLREQYVVGELITYLVEMDVSTEVFSFASSATPSELAFMSPTEAVDFRVDDNPRAMTPWRILPLASGLMIESVSTDLAKGVRFFCLGREDGRVHVQIMNKSADDSDNLVGEYASGTPELYFYPHIETFESSFRYGNDRNYDLALRFNKVLSEPESGFHVNFDFTMSVQEFEESVGATHLYFWPGHAYIPLVNYWGQFVAAPLPTGMNLDLNKIVSGNCV